MNNFIIKSEIESKLKGTRGTPVLSINFLGTGGAFNPKEKNSSVIISNSGGSILIDCGSTVYPILREQELLKDIKYTFITHCHEDHIGSLSTLVYHKAYVDKEEPLIETSEQVAPVVTSYLKDICSHPEETVKVNIIDGDVYPALQTRVTKIDTTDYHYKGMPTCGFVFQFRKNNNDFYILYSGDINVPFTHIIKEKNPELYAILEKKPDDVFIFHEATARDYPPYYPHCEFQVLGKELELFPNIFTYHHGQDEAETMDNDHKMKMQTIMKSIDTLKLELDKKLEIVRENNNIEAEKSLQEQADKKMKEFKEKLYEIQQSSKLVSLTKGAQQWMIYEQKKI